MFKKFTITFVTLLLFLNLTSFAAQTVPHWMTYIGRLYDDGGNMLPNGPIDVTFRILDGNSNVVYAERQTLDVRNGEITALVGNGDLLTTNQPSPGLPFEVFLPNSGMQMEVEVAGFSKQGPYQLTTQPFSAYSQNAISVMDNGVKSNSIEKGAIKYEHFSQQAKDELINEITGGRGINQLVYQDDMATIYRNENAASVIGVAVGTLHSSGKTDVQGVLQDFDKVLVARRNDIVEEYRQRTTADAAFQAADVSLNTRVTNIEQGSIPFTGDLNLNGKNITNVDKVDGVDVSAHKHDGTDGSTNLAAGFAKAWGVVKPTVDPTDPTAIGGAQIVEQSNISTVKYESPGMRLGRFTIELNKACNTFPVVVGACQFLPDRSDTNEGSGYTFTHDDPTYSKGKFYVYCINEAGNAENEYGKLKSFSLAVFCN